MDGFDELEKGLAKIKVRPARPATSDNSYVGAKTLSQDELEDVLRKAGWPEKMVPLMSAIGMAESNRVNGRAKVDSFNPGLGPGGKPTVERSYGLFQINMHPSLGRKYDIQRLQTDPVYNATVAKEIYDQQGLSAWGAYTDKRYKTYLRKTSGPVPQQPKRSPFKLDVSTLSDELRRELANPDLAISVDTGSTEPQQTSLLDKQGNPLSPDYPVQEEIRSTVVKDDKGNEFGLRPDDIQDNLPEGAKARLRDAEGNAFIEYEKDKLRVFEPEQQQSAKYVLENGEELTVDDSVKEESEDKVRLKDRKGRKFVAEKVSTPDGEKTIVRSATAPQAPAMRVNTVVQPQSSGQYTYGDKKLTPSDNTDGLTEGIVRLQDEDGETYLLDRKTMSIQDESLSTVGYEQNVALPTRSKLAIFGGDSDRAAAANYMSQIVDGMSKQFGYRPDLVRAFVEVYGITERSTGRVSYKAGQVLNPDQFYSETGRETFTATRRDVKRLEDFAEKYNSAVKDGLLQKLSSGLELSAEDAALLERMTEYGEIEMARTKGQVARQDLVRLQENAVLSGVSPRRAEIMAKIRVGQIDRDTGYRQINYLKVLEESRQQFRAQFGDNLGEYPAQLTALKSSGAISPEAYQAEMDAYAKIVGQSGDRWYEPALRAVSFGASSAGKVPTTIGGSLALILPNTWFSSQPINNVIAPSTELKVQNQLAAYGSFRNALAAQEKQKQQEAAREARIEALPFFQKWRERTIPATTGRVVQGFLSSAVSDTLRSTSLLYGEFAEQYNKFLGSIEPVTDAEDRTPYRIAEYLDKNVFSYLGGNEDISQEFFAGKVPTTIGGSLALMLPNTWFSKYKIVATAIFGTSTMMSQTYEEAKNAGASEQEAQLAAYVTSGLFGWTEILGINKALIRLNKGPAADAWQYAFRQVLKSAPNEIAEEVFLNEGPQTVGSNIVARLTYDPTRELDKGLGEALMLAGVSAGLVSTAVTLKNAIAYRSAVKAQLRQDMLDGGAVVRNYGDYGLFVYGTRVKLTDEMKPLVEEHLELKAKILQLRKTLAERYDDPNIDTKIINDVLPNSDQEFVQIKEAIKRQETIAEQLLKESGITQAPDNWGSGPITGGKDGAPEAEGYTFKKVEEDDLSVSTLEALEKPTTAEAKTEVQTEEKKEEKKEKKTRSTKGKGSALSAEAYTEASGDTRPVQADFPDVSQYALALGEWQLRYDAWKTEQKKVLDQVIAEQPVPVAEAEQPKQPETVPEPVAPVAKPEPVQSQPVVEQPVQTAPSKVDTDKLLQIVDGKMTVASGVTDEEVRNAIAWLEYDRTKYPGKDSVLAYIDSQLETFRRHLQPSEQQGQSVEAQVAEQTDEPQQPVEAEEKKQSFKEFVESRGVKFSTLKAYNPLTKQLRDEYLASKTETVATPEEVATSIPEEAPKRRSRKKSETKAVSEPEPAQEIPEDFDAAFAMADAEEQAAQPAAVEEKPKRVKEPKESTVPEESPVSVKKRLKQLETMADRFDAIEADADGETPSERKRDNRKALTAVKAARSKGLVSDAAVAEAETEAADSDKDVSEVLYVARQELDESIAKLEKEEEAERKRTREQARKTKTETAKSEFEKGSDALKSAMAELLRGSKPAEAADQSTVASAIRKASEADLATLEEVYGASRTDSKFLSALRDDIIAYTEKGANAVKKAIRPILKRMVALVLSGAMIFSAKEVSSATVAKVPLRRTVVQSLEEFAKVDSADKPFMIVDKLKATVTVYDRGGTAIHSSPVLLGATKGDTVSQELLRKSIAETTESDKITPAGRFELQLAQTRSGTVFNPKHRGPDTSLDFLPGEKASWAVHRLYVYDKSRKDRLGSETTEDNFVSFGCVNVSDAVYDDILKPAFTGGGVIYITPDTRQLTEVFPALVREQTDTEMPGQEVPVNAKPKGRKEDVDPRTLTIDERKALADASRNKRKQSVTAAKSEFEKGSDALKSAMAELLRGSKNTLGMGLPFDHETYERTKPLFKQALLHYAKATKNAGEAMMMFLREMIRDYADTKEMIRPYTVQYLTDVFGTPKAAYELPSDQIPAKLEEYELSVSTLKAVDEPVETAEEAQADTSETTVEEQQPAAQSAEPEEIVAKRKATAQAFLEFRKQKQKEEVVTSADVAEELGIEKTEQPEELPDEVQDDNWTNAKKRRLTVQNGRALWADNKYHAEPRIWLDGLWVQPTRTNADRAIAHIRNGLVRINTEFAEGSREQTLLQLHSEQGIVDIELAVKHYERVLRVRDAVSKEFDGQAVGWTVAEAKAVATKWRIKNKVSETVSKWTYELAGTTVLAVLDTSAKHTKRVVIESSGDVKLGQTVFTGLGAMEEYLVEVLLGTRNVNQEPAGHIKTGAQVKLNTGDTVELTLSGNYRYDPATKMTGKVTGTTKEYIQFKPVGKALRILSRNSIIHASPVRLGVSDYIVASDANVLAEQLATDGRLNLDDAIDALDPTAATVKVNKNTGMAKLFVILPSGVKEASGLSKARVLPEAEPVRAAVADTDRRIEDRQGALEAVMADNRVHPETYWGHRIGKGIRSKEEAIEFLSTEIALLTKQRLSYLLAERIHAQMLLDAMREDGLAWNNWAEAVGRELKKLVFVKSEGDVETALSVFQRVVHSLGKRMAGGISSVLGQESSSQRVVNPSRLTVIAAPTVKAAVTRWLQKHKSLTQVTDTGEGAVRIDFAERDDSYTIPEKYRAAGVSDFWLSKFLEQGGHEVNTLSDAEAKLDAAYDDMKTRVLSGAMSVKYIDALEFPELSGAVTGLIATAQKRALAMEITKLDNGVEEGRFNKAFAMLALNALVFDRVSEAEEGGVAHRRMTLVALGTSVALSLKLDVQGLEKMYTDAGMSRRPWIVDYAEYQDNGLESHSSDWLVRQMELSTTESDGSELQMLYDGARGSMSRVGTGPASVRLISLNESKASPSTIVHELAHFWLDVMFENRLFLHSELGVLSDWIGKVSSYEEFQEKFARGAEKFLYEGAQGYKADSIFQRFLTWVSETMRNTFGRFKDLNELTPEMRAVYADMLSLEALSGAVEYKTTDRTSSVHTESTSTITEERLVPVEGLHPPQPKPVQRTQKLVLRPDQQTFEEYFNDQGYPFPFEELGKYPELRQVIVEEWLAQTRSTADEQQLAAIQEALDLNLYDEDDEMTSEEALAELREKFPEQSEKITDPKYRGIRTRSWREKLMTGLAAAKNRVMRTYAGIDPNENKVNARATELFVLMSHVSNAALVRTQHLIREMVSTLSTADLSLFEHYIIARDALHDFESGVHKITDKKGMPIGDTASFLGKGATVAALFKEVQDKVSRVPIVAQAIAAREAILAEVVGEYVAEGLGNKEYLKNIPNYYHRQVHTLLDENENPAIVQSGNDDARVPFRTWTLSRVGSDRPYNTRFIESEYEWMFQMVEDTLQARYIKQLVALADIRPALEAGVKALREEREAAGDLTPVRVHVPKGFREVAAKKSPKLQRVMAAFKGTFDKLEDEGRLDELPDKLVPRLAVAEQTRWIFPEGIAEAFENYDPDHSSPNSFIRGLGWVSQIVKAYMLFAPTRFLAYRRDNSLSDMIAVFIAKPSLLKGYGKAMRLLTEAMLRHDSTKEEQRLIEEYTRLGLIGQGIVPTEIPDIHRWGSPLYEILKKEAGLKQKRGAIVVYKRMILTINDILEAVPRITAYNHYLERIKKGHKVYGASQRSMIDAIDDPKEKAARLANDVVGNYAAVSQNTRELRRFMSFWSFQEINLPRFVRMINNARFETGEAADPEADTDVKNMLKASAGGAVKGAFATAGVLARAAAPLAIMALFNGFIDPEKDKQLKRQGASGYLLLPYKGDDGETIVVYFPTPVLDALRTFGLDDFVTNVSRAMTNDLTSSKVKDELVDIPKNAINTLVQHADVLGKTGIELLFREQMFPSIFPEGRNHPYYGYLPQMRNMRSVKDNMLTTTGLMPVASIASWFDVKLSDRPRRITSNWVFRTANQLGGFVDVNELNFFYYKKKIGEWKRVNGLTDNFGGRLDDKAAAAYFFKMASRYGDEVAAKNHWEKYVELGGTPETILDSIQNTSLFGDLEEKDIARFYDSLSPEDKEGLEAAYQWYAGSYRVPIPGGPDVRNEFDSAPATVAKSRVATATALEKEATAERLKQGKFESPAEAKKMMKETAESIFGNDTRQFASKGVPEKTAILKELLTDGSDLETAAKYAGILSGDLAKTKDPAVAAQAMQIVVQFDIAVGKLEDKEKAAALRKTKQRFAAAAAF